MSQTKLLQFFTGLGDYVTYITKTPILQGGVDAVMEKKYEQYEALNGLEEQSLQELQKVKKVLLKIIKDNSLSPNSFRPHWPAVPGYSENLLDELRRFEEGEISSSNFKSDTLEGYLFEIAASITEQGHPELVKEFFVPDEEYRRYRPGIVSNIRGNFIFSKMLPKRWEKTQIIEKQKGFEIWPCFDALFKFHKAFGEISKNLTFAEAVNLMGKESRNYLESSDAVNVIFALEDLRKMSDNRPGYHSDNSRIHYLELEKFKWYTTRVHSHLLTEISEKETRSDSNSNKLYLDASGDLWREPKNKYCYPMGQQSDRQKIIRHLAAHKGYQSTSSITDVLGKTDLQLTRKEIAKIRLNVKKHLKVKEQIIESKKESGYRLNPNTRVTLLK